MRVRVLNTFRGRISHVAPAHCIKKQSPARTLAEGGVATLALRDASLPHREGWWRPRGGARA